MLPQDAFTVCAEVLPDRLQRLRNMLAGMTRSPGLADPHNALFPFGWFDQLHMSRFVIVESHTSDDVRAHGEAPGEWPPTLLFLGDCDGDAGEILDRMCDHAGAGLLEIFSHCKSAPATREALPGWMHEHNIRPAANYVNYIGRTVTQVREERALHSALRQRLSRLEKTGEGSDPFAVNQALREFIDDKLTSGELTLSTRPKTPLRWWLGNQLHRWLIPLFLLILSPLLILLLPFYLIALRWHERRDPEVLPRPDPQRVEELSALEDQLITNQFSAFGEVKPGHFRRYTMLFLLFMLNYSARHIYGRGYLTRVQTIHFSRWILLDDKKRLLFASNYDGSLESYMDDFINKVAWGLNLVFSNGIGYPRTRWLVKGGAEYEQKFKYYLRRHQLRTDVWYKAYPDLTAVELARNSRIRQGLEKSGMYSREAIQQWLSLI